MNVNLGTLKTLIKNRSHIIKVVGSYLYFLEHPDQTAWGSISEADEEGIARAVAAASDFSGPIVEVGSLFGHTTQLISTLKPRGKELIAVEGFIWNPFLISPADHRLFLRRSMRCCMESYATRIFEGSNKKFYQSYAGARPSMVFIDADHTYDGVVEDIQWASSQAVPVISGHDYDPMHPDVVRAVDERFGSRVQVFGSVWLFINLSKH